MNAFAAGKHDTGARAVLDDDFFDAAACPYFRASSIRRLVQCADDVSAVATVR